MLRCRKGVLWPVLPPGGARGNPACGGGKRDYLHSVGCVADHFATRLKAGIDSVAKAAPIQVEIGGFENASKFGSVGVDTENGGATEAVLRLWLLKTGSYGGGQLAE